jgi:hypothetical protein
MDTGSGVVLVVLVVIVATGTVSGLGAAASRRSELARVRVDGDAVVVKPVGVLKLLALTSGVRLPVSQLAAAFWVERPQERYRPGVRWPGTWLPGLLAGSFRGPEGRSFWVVGRGETSVRLDLDGHGYDYVVVDVADPAAVLSEINRARRP